MATELRKLKLRRVALVDKGANQEAFVTLFKREEAREVEHMADETKVEETAVATVTKADYDAVLEKAVKAESDATAARQEAENALAELAKRDEELELQKFATEAATVPHLGDKGPQWLRAIHKALGEDYPTFREALTALETQVKDSDLLRETGSNAEAGASEPETVATALAKRIRENDPTLTPEQALARAYDTPEYTAARRAAGGK